MSSLHELAEKQKQIETHKNACVVIEFLTPFQKLADHYRRRQLPFKRYTMCKGENVVIGIAFYMAYFLPELLHIPLSHFPSLSESRDTKLDGIAVFTGFL